MIFRRDFVLVAEHDFVSLSEYVTSNFAFLILPMPISALGLGLGGRNFVPQCCCRSKKNDAFIVVRPLARSLTRSTVLLTRFDICSFDDGHCNEV